MATAYIERGSESSPTSEQVFSFSAWVKFSDVTSSTEQMIFNQTRNGVSTDSCSFYKKAGGSLTLYVVSGSTGLIDLDTSRKFRDCSGWYNLAFNIDMANGTVGDRAKIFVNGVRETAFGTEDYPASTLNINCFDDNASNRTRIGGGAKESATVNMYLDGDLSHVHFVDGVAYAGSNWGSTDSTSGIWKIDPEPTVSSYGNRGFFLKMEDSSNLDLDSSPNATTMTTSGTLTATKDNPSNNFCTLNPLDNYGGVGGSGWSVFSNGNTHWTTGVANHIYAMGTMGVSAGLWYWEVTNTVASAGSGYRFGVADKGMYVADSDLGQFQSSYAYGSYNGNIKYNATGSNIDVSFGDTYTNGDIIGVYMDLDAGKIYFGKNGTIQNSGTGITIAAVNATNGFFMPSIADTNGNMEMNCNFGNGYFGTTAVTSAVADAGGVGAFEYDPSAGTFDSASKDFRALCTKNIKAYGG